MAVLSRKPPAIPDAFHHPRLGPIGLDFEGTKHIVDERVKQYPDSSEATTAKVLREVATAAVLGNPQEDIADRPGRKASRIAIVYGEHEVIVEPNWNTKYPDHAKGQTLWLVTDYRMDPNRKQRRADEGQSMAVKFDLRETK